MRVKFPVFGRLSQGKPFKRKAVVDVVNAVLGQHS